MDASTGPDGPHGTTAFWLVPANGYIAGQRVPYDHNEDLKAGKFDKTQVEGVEYYLVPEESTNLPGRLSHYAQLTGVAELQNPPGGGVNRVRETLENTSGATVAPEAVEKFVADNDSYEEARKKSSAENDRVDRQVKISPAREPAEGKLVVADADNKGGTQPSSEKVVKPTGNTK